METSILNSVKKILGLAPDYTVFDHDIITHINAVFFTLLQLGVGPTDGFMIESDAETWNQFIAIDDPQLNAVKTYIFLRVRMLFDPPATSYLIGAMERQIGEMEWRLNVRREETQWVDPDPALPDDEETVAFGFGL